MNPESYRYPHEGLILGVTLLLVAAVVVLTATATVCASLIFVGIFLAIAYNSTKNHQKEMLRAAQPGSAIPELDRLTRLAAQRLRPGAVDLFVLPSRQVNAYTFGLDTPKTVVLYSGLLRRMDADETLFVIGHEMGHIALGHTWLNSLVGGLAGIPSSFSAAAIMTLAFLWWNRMCEYSADRAGLLACGSPAKAISALLKLSAAGDDSVALERAYRQLDAEDDTWAGSLNEALATHPLLIRRINHLRQFAASAQYQKLAIKQ